MLSYILSRSEVGVRSKVRDATLSFQSIPTEVDINVTCNLNFNFSLNFNLNVTYNFSLNVTYNLDLNFNFILNFNLDRS